MTMNPRGSILERLFGPDFERHLGSVSSTFWYQKAAWEAQKASWKAQRHAQRAAWKAQCHADRWRHRGPFAAMWGLLWTVFWIGLLVLLVVSPEFRSSFVNFMLAIPKFVVHPLYSLAGRTEI